MKAQPSGSTCAPIRMSAAAGVSDSQKRMLTDFSSDDLLGELRRCREAIKRGELSAIARPDKFTCLSHNPIRNHRALSGGCALPMDAVVPEFEELEIGDFGRRRGCDGAIDQSSENAMARDCQDFLQDGQPGAAIARTTVR